MEEGQTTNKFSVEILNGPEETLVYQSLCRYLGFEAVLRTIFFNKLRFTRVACFEDEWELRRGRKSREINEKINKEISEDANMPHMPWPFRALSENCRNLRQTLGFESGSFRLGTRWSAPELGQGY